MIRKSSLPIKSLVGVLLGAVILVLAVACGSDPTAIAPAATEQPSGPAATAAAPATQAPAMPTATKPIEGHQPTPPPATAAAPSVPSQGENSTYTPSRDGEELNVILATTVLNEGTQRVAFLLTTGTGLVKDTSVSITPVYVPDNTTGDTVSARFNEWPYGTRGTFATKVEFDRPGQWRLDITAEGADATGWGVQELEVTADSPVPSIGAPAPLSDNKTLPGFGDLALITTDYSPDESLYQLSVREAVENPLPSVVVFASPAFCTTATCGPQVDTVSELRAAYDGQANFIHVEIYDNPDEIQGNLDRAEIAPTVDEWGLTDIEHWFNESWTFVLDTDGLVQARFEGFATFTELEESLQAVLN